MSVFCPCIDRTGGMFSFANLANAAICGCATQFGTRICSRLVSYATVEVLPKRSDTLLEGALRILRSGATFPFAPNGYTVTDELPRFTAHSSLFFVSMVRPTG